MTQENVSTYPSFVCDDVASAAGPSTDNITWLNKLCTELGYHNLAFLAKYGPPQSPDSIASEAVSGAAVSNAVSDGVTVDGCIGVTGHKIIKAVVGIILEHLVDRQ